MKEVIKKMVGAPYSTVMILGAVAEILEVLLKAMKKES